MSKTFELSTLARIGLRSRSSRFSAPRETCASKSVRPIISSILSTPSSASISLTSSAMKVIKFITFSGVPVNFSRSRGSWTQTPTGHVFEWHWRTIMHPIATRLNVPMPYSSAPSIAAITMSRPVFNPPSVLKVTESRRLLSVRTW